MVRTNNLVLSGADSAVVVLKEANKALSMKTDCNSRYVYLNPYRGGMIAVAEAARNVVCTGAEPLAITNCLNFGNPYKPEVYWQFREAVRGMGDACRALGTPVTGGNVSFYNESPIAYVYPTPVVGMLGLVTDLAHVTTADFKANGDVIVLLGRLGGHVGGSEYLSMHHGIVGGDAPSLDIAYEISVQQACLRAIRTGIIKSAHDCSEGGLAMAITESCITGGQRVRGARITLPASDMRPDFVLFGEDQSRIVVSTSESDVGRLMDICFEAGVDASRIGHVGGSRLEIGGLMSIECSRLARQHMDLISKTMNI
jgi:phosphoribosylformylglycinamidine synthase